MQLFYYLDRDFENLNTRLPLSEIQELNRQFNVNLFDSELHDEWLDHTEMPEHMRVCDESEIFNADNYGIQE